MPSNYLTPDPIQGTVDLDDRFITDAWLVDQFVGGTLFGWGSNSSGQIGNGFDVSYSSPIQIGSLNNWRQVYCGDSSTGSIKTDGTLWTWGRNNNGQLGNGTTINYSSPIQIGALTGWKEVAMASRAAGFYTGAIGINGTLWAWGRNNQGQLGNGTTVDYSSPIQVGSLTNWKQIDGTKGSGSATFFAIKTDGTLWGWGGGGQGQLGNGFTVNYSSPIQIGSLTNWKQVAGHSFSFAAIKTDGTLWGCGYNFYGQIGNGTAIAYTSPVQVGSLTNWKQISGGQNFVAAVKTDGTLWTWGRNNNGQLGNGTTINYSSPIQIGALTNWKQVSFGTSPTMAAIKTDGTLWTCGYNASGQLGNGTIINYSSPIQIGSLTNWKQVGSGFRLAAITFRDIT